MRDKKICRNKGERDNDIPEIHILSPKEVQEKYRKNDS